MNLTRITDPVEAAVMHYADSLALLVWARQQHLPIETLLDVGTGAGFPALPLAVMQPDWMVTALDATKKKVDFLARTAAAVGVDNLYCVHGHSRHWNHATFDNQRAGAGFDLVVSRALSRLAGGLHQTARHVTPGGWLVAYKTAKVSPEEQREAQVAAPALQLRLDQRFAYDLVYHGNVAHRILYVYRKAS